MGMALHVQVYRTQGAAYFTVLSLRMAVTDIRITPPCLLRWKMTRDFLMKGCYGENGRGVCGICVIGNVVFLGPRRRKGVGVELKPCYSVAVHICMQYTGLVWYVWMVVGKSLG